MKSYYFRFPFLFSLFLGALMGCKSPKEKLWTEQLAALKNICADAGLKETEFEQILGGRNPETGEITRLDFSNRGLTYVSAQIGAFTGLLRLDLSGNSIKTLPEEIGSLASLENLDLGQNNLTALPESIGNLQKLERLDVSDNELTELPSTLGRLGELSELWVAGNKLSKFPDSLQGLHKLTYVAIVRNDFTEFPRSLLQMPNFSSILADADEIDTNDLPEGVVYKGNGSFVYTRSAE